MGSGCTLLGIVVHCEANAALQSNAGESKLTKESLLIQVSPGSLDSIKALVHGQVKLHATCSAYASQPLLS